MMILLSLNNMCSRRLLICKRRKFVLSFLNMLQNDGVLPFWTCNGNCTVLNVCFWLHRWRQCMQAYHDEVVFFHVSNSSGLWFAPWPKRRRQLSFVHYCKQPVRVHGTSFWRCRRKKTKKRRRTTRRQHGFSIQTKVLDCLICLLLATNKKVLRTAKNSTAGKLHQGNVTMLASGTHVTR